MNGRECSAAYGVSHGSPNGLRSIGSRRHFPDLPRIVRGSFPLLPRQLPALIARLFRNGDPSLR